MENLKINDLLIEIMDILRKKLNIKNAVIRKLIDDELIMVASYGYEDNEIKEVRKLREDISGLCASKNITVVINDLEVYNDVYFKGINCAKSTISVPITLNGEVVGTFNAASIYKNNFDENKIEIIEKITNIFKNALRGYPDLKTAFLNNFIMKYGNRLYGNY